MAKKNAKMANRNVGLPKKNDNEPQAQFRVITPAGEPIYLVTENGISLTEAVRRAQGLVADAAIAQIGPDGDLYPGSVDLTDAANPVFTPLTPLPVEEEEVAA